MLAHLKTSEVQDLSSYEYQRRLTKLGSLIHKNNNIGQTRTCPVLCIYYYIKYMDFPIKNEEVDSAHYQFSSWNHSNSGHSNKKVEVKDPSSCIKRLNCAIPNNNNIGETTMYHVLSKCTIVDLQLYMLCIQVLECPIKRERESA